MSCRQRQRDAATHTARLQVGWYIIFMVFKGGGGVVVKIRDDCKQDFGPGFKSPKSLICFFFTDDGQKLVDKITASSVWYVRTSSLLLNTQHHHTEYVSTYEPIIQHQINILGHRPLLSLHPRRPAPSPQRAAPPHIVRPPPAPTTHLTRRKGKKLIGFFFSDQQHSPPPLDTRDRHT